MSKRVLGLLWVVVCLAGCGGSEDSNAPLDSQRLLEHVQALPAATSETDLYGEAVAADCKRTRYEHRGERVWLCGIEHADGTVGEWCAVSLDGEILTNREGAKFRCDEP